MGSIHVILAALLTTLCFITQLATAQNAPNPSNCQAKLADCMQNISSSDAANDVYQKCMAACECAELPEGSTRQTCEADYDKCNQDCTDTFSKTDEGKCQTEQTKCLIECVKEKDICRGECAKANTDMETWQTCTEKCETDRITCVSNGDDD